MRKTTLWFWTRSGGLSVLIALVGWRNGRRKMSKPKPPKCDYENYDGVKYEEEKKMHSKLTTPKSRWSWSFSDIPDEDWPFPKKEQ